MTLSNWKYLIKFNYAQMKNTRHNFYLGYFCEKQYLSCALEGFDNKHVSRKWELAAASWEIITIIFVLWIPYRISKRFRKIISWTYSAVNFLMIHDERIKRPFYHLLFLMPQLMHMFLIKLLLQKGKIIIYDQKFVDNLHLNPKEDMDISKKLITNDHYDNL